MKIKVWALPSSVMKWSQGRLSEMAVFIDERNAEGTIEVEVDISVYELNFSEYNPKIVTVRKRK